MLLALTPNGVIVQCGKKNYSLCRICAAARNTQIRFAIGSPAGEPIGVAGTEGLVAVITMVCISRLWITATGCYYFVQETIGQILGLIGIEIFVAFDAGIIGDLADKDPEVC